MIIKKLYGDLLDYAKRGYFDIIIHGCNCQHIMGKGIAKQIRASYPEMFEIDCKSPRVAPGKILYHEFNGLTVINAYTQIAPGGPNIRHKIRKDNHDIFDTRDNRLNFIKESMLKVNDRFKGKKIGIPKIGAGLAGGEWFMIEYVIKQSLKDNDVTLVCRSES
jgi:O-acetyl-ADP-ribose deacetylase (regulator of RNase III)